LLPDAEGVDGKKENPEIAYGFKIGFSFN